MDVVYIIIGIFLGLVALYLISSPENTQKVKNFFRDQGMGLVKSARNRLAGIQALWQRTDFIKSVQENRDEIHAQIAESEEMQAIAREKRRRAAIEGRSRFSFLRRARPTPAASPAPAASPTPGPAPAPAPGLAPTPAPAALPEIDYVKIRADAEAAATAKIDRILDTPLDSGTILNAWVRRFLYTGLVIVMITTDTGITVFRLEALRFFNIPKELQPLLNNVFFLTPLVFISSLILAKMALDEISPTLSPAVKLVPFERGFNLTLKKFLPYVIICLGLLNSLLLVYAASSIGSGADSSTTFRSYEFFLFIGLLLLVLMASYLGITAFVQTLALLVGVPFSLLIAAIGVVVGLCELMLSAVLGLLESIGNSLRPLVRRLNPIDKFPPPPPNTPTDGTILLGLGASGTQMAVKVGNVLRELSKPFSEPSLLYADVYSPETADHIRARDQLRDLAIAKLPPQITVEPSNLIDELSQTLTGVHPLDAKASATIICLVRDNDMDLALPALKQYEAYIKASHALHHVTVHNPIRIVMIWMLPRDGVRVGATSPGALAQAAHNLEVWANDNDSLLAGTILISDDSSLYSDAPDHERLIARAIASYIMAFRYKNALSLEEIARQMKGSHSTFSALATGTIGVNGLVLIINGQRTGVMDDSFISVRLHTLMEEYFENKLTSYDRAPTPLSAVKFATVISPQNSALLDKVRLWVTDPEFDIVPSNLAFIPADLAPKIDLSVTGKFPDHGGQSHPQLSLIYTVA